MKSHIVCEMYPCHSSPQDGGTAEGGQEHKESLPPESFQVESDVQVHTTTVDYYVAALIT